MVLMVITFFTDNLGEVYRSINLATELDKKEYKTTGIIIHLRHSNRGLGDDDDGW
jgi:hypothetical protein